MKLHTLKPAKGATHKEKRLGRGEASGKGGTSTKGNKGGQSRAGYKSKMAHEGGQMPIQRRLPKRGFKNNNRIEYKVFNIGQVDHLSEKFFHNYKIWFKPYPFLDEDAKLQIRPIPVNSHKWEGNKPPRFSLPACMPVNTAFPPVGFMKNIFKGG